MPGRVFHTHKGALAHDDLIGQPEGIVATTLAGVPYLVLRPLLRDFVLSMPRGATVIYPKDAAAIVGLADIFPGAHVVEAGVGSGALTCSLLRAVGPTGPGHLLRAARGLRRDRAGQRRAVPRGPAAELVGRGGGPPGRASHAHGVVHRVVLDMLAPVGVRGRGRRRADARGIVVTYVATTTQLSRMAETLRADGRFTEPAAQRAACCGPGTWRGWRSARTIG